MIVFKNIICGPKAATTDIQTKNNNNNNSNNNNKTSTWAHSKIATTDKEQINSNTKKVQLGLQAVSDHTTGSPGRANNKPRAVWRTVTRTEIEHSLS